MSLTSRPCDRPTTAMKRTDPTNERPYGRAYSRSRRRSFIDGKLSRVRLFQACASRVRLFKDAQAFECGNDARDAHLGETFGSDHDLGFGSPWSPDGRVGSTEENDAGHAEGGS